MPGVVRGANWKKAKFYNADTGAEVVECHFNPNDFTVTRSNKWEAQEASGAGLPDVTFGGMGARTLQMTLVFDSYESKSDITLSTGKLAGLMEVPNVQSPSGRAARPPHVEFGWGNFRSFRAVITQMSQKFTLFTADGTPVRATVQVTLQEVPKEAAKKQGKGQNPTSVATGARKVRIVQPGDTIDWLAADELGDPNAWRRLAEANRLDDPRRLLPGQV
ncbi:MAG: CIS tube protein, partial [Chloroflexota bacterium]